MGFYNYDILNLTVQYHHNLSNTSLCTQLQSYNLSTLTMKKACPKIKICKKTFQVKFQLILRSKEHVIILLTINKLNESRNRHTRKSIHLMQLHWRKIQVKRCQYNMIF